MPNENDSPTNVIISPRDIRLANALLASASTALAPMLASLPSHLHVGMEMMSIASCCSDCNDPRCESTMRTMDWLAQAISYVDHGAPLEAHAEVDEFRLGMMEPVAPPSLLRRIGSTLFPGFVASR